MSSPSLLALLPALCQPHSPGLSCDAEQGADPAEQEPNKKVMSAQERSWDEEGQQAGGWNHPAPLPDYRTIKHTLRPAGSLRAAAMNSCTNELLDWLCSSIPSSVVSLLWLQRHPDRMKDFAPSKHFAGANYYCCAVFQKRTNRITCRGAGSSGSGLLYIPALSGDWILLSRKCISCCCISKGSIHLFMAGISGRNPGSASHRYGSQKPLPYLRN